MGKKLPYISSRRQGLIKNEIIRKFVKKNSSSQKAGAKYLIKVFIRSNNSPSSSAHQRMSREFIVWCVFSSRVHKQPPLISSLSLSLGVIKT
jgi:CRISPR/Cas system CMR-associated protein Cmr1 (group 7 of RAMP superfamily)